MGRSSMPGKVSPIRPSPPRLAILEAHFIRMVLLWHFAPGPGASHSMGHSSMPGKVSPIRPCPPRLEILEAHNIRLVPLRHFAPLCSTIVERTTANAAAVSSVAQPKSSRLSVRRTLLWASTTSWGTCIPVCAQLQQFLHPHMR